jgi:hypothetical protein
MRVVGQDSFCPTFLSYQQEFVCNSIPRREVSLKHVLYFHVQPDLKVDLLSDYVIRRFGQESVCTFVDPHPLRKEDMSARLNAPDSKEWLILVSTRAAMQRSLAIDGVRTVIILDNEKDMQHEMEVRHAGSVLEQFLRFIYLAHTCSK